MIIKPFFLAIVLTNFLAVGSWVIFDRRLSFLRAVKNPRIWPWMVITAGAVLRADHLSSAPLWYDESFTLLLARLPWPQLLQATLADVHPPFYYLAISSLLGVFFWLPAVLVLRVFSLVLGVASLLVFWGLSNKVGISFPGRLASLAILALAPVEIFYSQEGRMYALLQLLVMLQIWCLIKKSWLGLGLATLLLLYTHNYGVIYTAVIGLAGLGLVGRSTQLARLAGAVGLPGLAYLPWLGSQLAATTATHWLQPITAGGVVVVLLRGLVGHHLPVGGDLLGVICLAVVLVLAVGHGITHRQWLLLCWGIGPLVLLLAVSILYRPILLHRGLYGSLPALALLAGAVWVSACGAGAVGRWLLTTPWLLALVWQLGAGYAGIDHSNVLWPPQLAGMVYHIEDTSLITIQANYPGTDNYLLDSGCPDQPGALTQATRLALGIKQVKLADLPEHYQLAAVVGPMATACHEKVFTSLASTCRAVYRVDLPYGVYGIWQR